MLPDIIVKLAFMATVAYAPGPTARPDVSPAAKPTDAGTATPTAWPTPPEPERTRTAKKGPRTKSPKARPGERAALRLDEAALLVDALEF